MTNKIKSRVPDRLDFAKLINKEEASMLRLIAFDIRAHAESKCKKYTLQEFFYLDDEDYLMGYAAACEACANALEVKANDIEHGY